MLFFIIVLIFYQKYVIILSRQQFRRKKMQKLTILILAICTLFLMTGCEFSYTTTENSNIEQQERPVLHTQDIEVEITSISKSHRFVKVHRYHVSMEVYSKEYNIRKTFSYDASGMFINLPSWSYDKGDIVKAELHTWIYESTGTIQKQYINKVY